MSDVNQLREDVGEIKEQMVTNIGKVIDRGEKLEDLNKRTDVLNARASEFEVVGRALHRKLWWQNARLWLIIIIIAIVILIVLAGIIAGIVVGTSN